MPRNLQRSAAHHEAADIFTVDTEPPAVAEPHAHPDLPGDATEAEPATDQHGNR